MLVSVILPTYNRKNVIERAINSVMNQSYADWELIIVDDGSVDGTEEYIKQFFCSGKTVFLRQINRGVSAARNRGVSQAQGEYIAFIDSDDEWTSCKLERQIDFFKKNNGVGLVFSNVTIINPDGSQSEKPELFPHSEDAIFGLKEIFVDPFLGVPTVMMTKKLFEAVGGFNESLRAAEDVDLFLRASLCQPFGYIHEKLVNVYKTAGSLSAFVMEGGNIPPIEDNINVVKRFIDANKSHVLDVYNCDVNLVMSNCYLGYGRALMAMGRVRSSREKFALACRYKISLESIYLLIKSYLKKVDSERI